MAIADGRPTRQETRPSVEGNKLQFILIRTGKVSLGNLRNANTGFESFEL